MKRKKKPSSSPTKKLKIRIGDLEKVILETGGRIEELRNCWKDTQNARDFLYNKSETSEKEILSLKERIDRAEKTANELKSKAVRLEQERLDALKARDDAENHARQFEERIATAEKELKDKQKTLDELLRGNAERIRMLRELEDYSRKTFENGIDAILTRSS